jgi:hypothetical protein
VVDVSGVKAAIFDAGVNLFNTAKEGRVNKVRMTTSLTQT